MDDERLSLVREQYDDPEYLSIKMWHNIEKTMYMDLEKTNIEGWTLSQLMNNKHVTVMHSINKKDINGFDLYTLDIVNVGSDTQNTVYEGSYVITPMIEGGVYIKSLGSSNLIPIQGLSLKLVGNLTEQ